MSFGENMKKPSWERLANYFVLIRDNTNLLNYVEGINSAKIEAERKMRL